MVQTDKAKLIPFNRDHLFASIHDSCRHRASHIDDATALTQTIISTLVRAQRNGILNRDTVVRTAHETLSRFDQTAAAIYAAYHPARQENQIIS